MNYDRPEHVAMDGTPSIIRTAQAIHEVHQTMQSMRRSQAQLERELNDKAMQLAKLRAEMSAALEAHDGRVEPEAPVKAW